MRRLAFALVLCAPVVAQAQIEKYVPAHSDPRHVFVLDSAHLLTEATIARIQATAVRLQNEDHTDLAVVTLPTLGGRSVEEAALYIGRTWGVGSKMTNMTGPDAAKRGMVLLYVPNKATVAGPNVRVEVSRGLEGTITDSKSHLVINAMKPAFAKTPKDYNTGFLAGVEEAATLITDSYNVSKRVGTPVVATDDGRRSDWVWAFVATLITLIGVIGYWVHRRTVRQEQEAIRRMNEELAEQERLARAARNRHGHPFAGLQEPRTYFSPPVARPAYNDAAAERRRHREEEEEEERRRRRRDEESSSSFFSSDDSSSSSSSSSDFGGSFGGDSGFSGGGSSDSI